jgi:hypothetical protein
MVTEFHGTEYHVAPATSSYLDCYGQLRLHCGHDILIIRVRNIFSVTPLAQLLCLNSLRPDIFMTFLARAVILSFERT